MSEATPLVGGNPGWAGETGEFSHLTEADIRGTSYFGSRPLSGDPAGGGVCAYPYQLLRKNPSAPLFEGPYAERLQLILSRYPDKQGALLPTLNLAQEVRGVLTPDAMDTVADILELSPSYVRGVATFYTMYNKQPVGDFLIQVCTNVACNMCGGDEVMHAFLDATGTESGETTADGRFTVIEAECLGACGVPTAIQINERYFENVMPENVPAILEQLRNEASTASNGANASNASNASNGAR
jgi:NADH-quinone oxidoreductase E subunit